MSRKKTQITEETAGLELLPFLPKERVHSLFRDYMTPTLVVLDFEDYMEHLGFPAEVKS